MAHAFTLWLGRFWTSAPPALYAPPSEQQLLKIEVERLPDYLWRELGFQQPRRPDEDVWPR